MISSNTVSQQCWWTTSLPGSRSLGWNFRTTHFRRFLLFFIRVAEFKDGCGLCRMEEWMILADLDHLLFNFHSWSISRKSFVFVIVLKINPTVPNSAKATDTFGMWCCYFVTLICSVIDVRVPWGRIRADRHWTRGALVRCTSGLMWRHCKMACLIKTKLRLLIAWFKSTDVDAADIMSC